MTSKKLISTSLIIAFAIVLTSSSSWGQNFYYVNSSNDNPKMRSTDRDGKITLREALTAAATDQPFGDAQAGQQYDIIKLDRLSPRQPTIYLNGPLVVDLPGPTNSIGIVGDAFKKNKTIDGRGRFQILVLRNHASVHMKWVNLANGSGTNGGAISSSGPGSLEFSYGEIVKCSAALGGAIYKSGGQFTSTKASYLNNHANFAGGAVYTDTDAVQFRGTTVARNHAGIAGGGIFFKRSQYYGSYNLDQSTITQNTVGLGKTNNPYGGGIADYGTSPIGILCDGTLIADNHAIVNGSYENNDAEVIFQPMSYWNLIGAIGESEGLHKELNQQGTSASPIDPMLSILGYHQSLHTRNFIPNPLSPAIDRGSPTPILNFGIPQLDQRGLPRTVGVYADVGSVERQ